MVKTKRTNNDLGKCLYTSTPIEVVIWAMTQLIAVMMKWS